MQCGSIQLWKFGIRIFQLSFVVFLGGSVSKDSACNAGGPGSIPGLGRSSGEGNGYPLPYSCLENSLTEEPGGLHRCHKESDMIEQLTHTMTNSNVFKNEFIIGVKFIYFSLTH